jgi:hypothetical protein
MRFALTLVPALALGCFLMPSPGHADPYKWCAIIGKDGISNCGFVTLEQCRANVSGLGGFCEPNQFYTGPAKNERRATKRNRNVR